MNEFCSIIDRGSLLFQSLRHLLFISQYLCCQIGLSYGSLKQQWYRWQEISHEIDNDEERCHIKSEGATVNIPARRRVFLASTLLQGLFFFWLQLKFTLLPRNLQPLPFYIYFPLFSSVLTDCPLRWLTFAFFRWLRSWLLKAPRWGKGRGEKAFESTFFLNKDTTMQRSLWKPEWYLLYRCKPSVHLLPLKTNTMFIKTDPCLRGLLERLVSRVQEWGLGKVNTAGGSAVGSYGMKEGMLTTCSTEVPWQREDCPCCLGRAGSPVTKPTGPLRGWSFSVTGEETNLTHFHKKEKSKVSSWCLVFLVLATDFIKIVSKLKGSPSEWSWLVAT